MEIALVIATGVICLFSFVIGAKVGQSVSKGEDVLRNPVEAVQEHREKREAKLEAKVEQDRIAVIMQNIEGYDGTGRGQKDVPRG